MNNLVALTDSEGLDPSADLCSLFMVVSCAQNCDIVE